VDERPGEIGGAADVAPHEPVAQAVRDRREVGQVAGVGQLVEHRDLGVLEPEVPAREQGLT
jgi:hypothetical protein